MHLVLVELWLPYCGSCDCGSRSRLCEVRRVMTTGRRGGVNVAADA